MIKSHPSEAILYQYASGDLSAAMTLVVGTHVDMCSVCQQTVCEIEHDLCHKHLDTVVDTLSKPCLQVVLFFYFRTILLGAEILWWH